ncbi:MAG: discoidin domain-containing protein [Nakamurella sp.]
MLDTSSPAPGGKTIASNDFEGNQPGWGPFVKGDAGGNTDPRTSISVLHAPYSQQTWKNTWSPYNTGTLKGLAVDDVLDGKYSLKSHEENTGLVYRTVPATVPFSSGHSYTVSFDYQTNLAGQWQWVIGADQVSAGKVTSTVLKTDNTAVALSTKRFSSTFVGGCGDSWVGLQKVGSAGGTDFVLDNFTVVDNGASASGATCGTVGAGAGSLSPGVPASYVTTFTNHESQPATNVALSIADLPAGWKAEVKDKNANLFAKVAPGKTVTTSWLITPPASAAGTSATVQPTAVYFNQCAVKTSTADAVLTVSDRPMVPTSVITATTDSQEDQGGSAEGPVSNVLDGDLSTIWHTGYSDGDAPYPHWVQLDLGSTYQVDGFGYQDRQSGGPNGRVKDYQIEVSSDGTSWTKVTSGSLVDTAPMQVIPFDSVSARYVRFTALDALNGLAYAAAAEMRVFGKGGDLPTGFPPATRPADTTCKPVISQITDSKGVLHAGDAVAGRQTFTVSVDGAKSGGISYTYIELNSGGRWITDNTKAPGSTNSGPSPTLVVDTSPLTNGTYQLKIDTVGKNGVTTEKIVKFVVRNLTVAFTTPAAGATVKRSVVVAVTLDGIDLKAYNLRVDSAGLQYTAPPARGTQRFTLDSTTLSNGKHTLLATATNAAGAKMTVTRVITVPNG